MAVETVVTHVRTSGPVTRLVMTGRLMAVVVPIILWFAPRYIWWLLPVLAGLVLSAPLTMLTSRAGAGQWLRYHDKQP